MMDIKYQIWVITIFLIVLDGVLGAAIDNETTNKNENKILYRISNTDPNKALREEIGMLENGKYVIHGKYVYITPEGQKALVYYVADENGYRAKTSLKGAVDTEEPISIQTLIGAPEGAYGGFGGGVGAQESGIIPPDVLKSLLGG